MRIRGHVVENVELTGLIAHSASEITEDLKRLAIEDQYSLMAPVNNVQVALLGSGEKVVLEAVSADLRTSSSISLRGLPNSSPVALLGTILPRLIKICAKYLPSSVKTWTRWFLRSQTYTRPSFDMRTP